MISKTMNGSCILFFISAIFACRAETENVQLKFLLEEMATLRKAVSTMEDVLKSQRDVIGDLRIQNQRQEKRIQDLETASKNRDECSEKLENFIRNKPALLTESKHTTSNGGHSFIPGIKERIGKPLFYSHYRYVFSCSCGLNIFALIIIL